MAACQSRVVVIRRTPVGDLFLRLDQFAAVAAARAFAQRRDVAGLRLPSRIRDDRHAGQPSSNVMFSSAFTIGPSLPAFLSDTQRPTAAQPQADTVLSLDEVRGDVVSQVEPALAVVGDRRAEHIIAHLLAVDVAVRNTPRRRRRSVAMAGTCGNVTVFRSQGSGPSLFCHPVCADPIAVPVGGRKRSDAE